MQGINPFLRNPRIPILGQRPQQQRQAPVPPPGRHVGEIRNVPRIGATEIEQMAKMLRAYADRIEKGEIGISGAMFLSRALHIDFDADYNVPMPIEHLQDAAAPSGEPAVEADSVAAEPAP